MSEEAMTEFLRSKGWQYGLTRDHGWKWAHPNIVRGVYWTLEAAYCVETRERVSERAL